MTAKKKLTKAELVRELATMADTEKKIVNKSLHGSSGPLQGSVDPADELMLSGFGRLNEFNP